MNSKMIKIELHEDGNYIRIHVSHPSFKGRIRKRIGNKNNINIDKDSLKMRIKFEFERHFKDNEFDKTSAESFIENYISMYVKHTGSIFDFIDEFLEIKAQTRNRHTRETLSKSTLSGYRTALKYFEEFLSNRNIIPHPSNISESVLNDFYYYINGRHNYKVKIHLKVKTFIKYLEVNKSLLPDPSYRLSVFNEEYDNQCPEDNDIALSEGQVAQLIDLREKFLTGTIRLDKASDSIKIPQSIRDQQDMLKKANLIKCLDCFLFMISTGMYYSDIVKSKIYLAVSDSSKHLRYRRAKNNKLCKGIAVKNEGVFISEAIIAQYKISNGSNFPLNMSLTHFNKHLKRISDLAGIDKITNKMARKTFASILHFNREMPIHLIQIVLGHTNVTRTMHYLRISDDSLVAKINGYM